MENYKLTSYGIIRLSDNAFIRGPDATNADWIAYTDWLSLGNTPQPEFTLDQLKSRKKDSINRECNIAIVGGFVSSTLGTPHLYDSDIEDQINLIASFIASQAMPVVLYRCTNIATNTKNWENHTSAQMQQLYADGVTFKTTQLITASTLKLQVDAATTTEQISAIIWVP